MNFLKIVIADPNQHVRRKARMLFILVENKYPDYTMKLRAVLHSQYIKAIHEEYNTLSIGEPGEVKGVVRVDGVDVLSDQGQEPKSKLFSPTRKTESRYMDIYK